MNSESQIERNKLVIPIMSDFVQLPIHNTLRFNTTLSHFFINNLLFVYLTNLEMLPDEFFSSVKS